MKIKFNTIMFFLTGAIFLLLTGPSLFSDGMVMDGTLYAAISRNLANGLGSFWIPFLSETLFPTFYEHPPLAFGIQSVWFKVFGDSIYVERFYSLFTFVIIALLIVKVWQEIGRSKQTAWIPLLLYFITKKVAWSCANNMLENTMTVFLLGSVLFYFKSMKGKSSLYIIISGLLLALAFLSKGFVALYIWVLPFSVWIMNQHVSFIKMCLKTILLIASTLLPFLLLYLFYSEAADSLIKYINQQVIGSIQGRHTVDSRFFIIQAVVYHYIIPVSLCLTILVIGKISKIKIIPLSKTIKAASPFLLLAISGILPIMVSLKQSGHYAISTYPFIALALALFIEPIITALSEKYMKTIQCKVLSILTLVVLIFSISTAISQRNKIGREQEMVADIYTIIEEIGRDKTISVCPNMEQKYYIHGYFARYGNISVSTSNKPTREYLVSAEECSTPNFIKGYKEISVDIKKYHLYKKE